MFAISGTKLDIGYEERLILKDFDMTVRKGEITTFVGPNGSGKSTLLKTLTRLQGCLSHQEWQYCRRSQEPSYRPYPLLRQES